MTSRRDRTAHAIANVSRRGLLAGVGAGALVLAVRLAARPRSAQEPEVRRATRCRNGRRDDPQLFVAIAEDGTVTIVCHRSEMGQGVRTSHRRWSSPTSSRPTGRKVQRRAGAGRRAALRQPGHRRLAQHAPLLAADAPQSAPPRARCWSRPRPSAGACRSPRCAAANHEVVHAASGRTLGYGELAKAAAALPVPPRDSAASSRTRRSSATSARARSALVDNLDITTGKAVYGIDTRAATACSTPWSRGRRCYGGKVASLRRAEALKVPGVVKVVRDRRRPPIPSEFQPLGGVAVVATQHLGGDQGPRGAEDHLGRRPERLLLLRHLPGAARGGGAQARQGGAQRGRRRRGAMPAPRSKSRRSTTSRISRTPRWSRRRRRCASSTAAARSGPACRRRRPRATRIAKRLGLPEDKVTVHVTLLGGGFGRKSKPDFVDRGGASVARRWTARRSRSPGRARTTSSNGYYHTVSVERLEAGLDAGGKPVAWLHRSAAPTIVSLFAPDPKHELPFELGMGARQHAVRHPEPAGREPARRRRTRASAGSARCPTSRTPSRSSPSSPSSRAAAGRDPKDYLLELIGPPRMIDPSGDRRRVELRRGPEALPDRHRPPAPRDRDGGASGIGWGRSLPAGQRPRHRRRTTASSPTSRRRSEVEVERQGSAHHPARRHRGRLRAAGQPGARALADGGRGRHGHEPRDAGRDHLQERPRRAEQLRRLRGHAHRRRAARDPGAPRAVERLRRGRSAASASRACRRSRRRSPTRSSPRPASASASCRSATSCAPKLPCNWRPIAKTGRTFSEKVHARRTGGRDERPALAHALFQERTDAGPDLPLLFRPADRLPCEHEIAERLDPSVGSRTPAP